MISLIKNMLILTLVLEKNSWSSKNSELCSLEFLLDQKFCGLVDFFPKFKPCIGRLKKHKSS